jgi:hypothetical protein
MVATSPLPYDRGDKSISNPFFFNFTYHRVISVSGRTSLRRAPEMQTRPRETGATSSSLLVSVALRACLNPAKSLRWSFDE